MGCLCHVFLLVGLANKEHKGDPKLQGEGTLASSPCAGCSVPGPPWHLGLLLDSGMRDIYTGVRQARQDARELCPVLSCSVSLLCPRSPTHLSLSPTPLVICARFCGLFPDLEFIFPRLLPSLHASSLSTSGACSCLNHFPVPFTPPSREGLSRIPACSDGNKGQERGATKRLCGWEKAHWIRSLALNVTPRPPPSSVG